MYELPPSPPEAPPPPPPAPAPVKPQPTGRALALLAEVRAAQQRALWTQGLLLGVAALVASVVAGGFVGAVAPRLGQWVVAAGPLLAVALLAGLGVGLSRRRVGDDVRTARHLAAKAPELNFDLLAAVELSRALGERHDFSPELARAFVREVDRRAARHTASALVDGRGVRRAGAVTLATVACALVLLAWKGATIRGGLESAFAARKAAEVTKREPITGDVELQYRYPAYTGREPLSVPGSTGDLSAPAGTEVVFKTRADRDVDGAALLLNGQRVPLRVTGRELSGTFILDASGQYHVAFLDGSEVVAEGPDRSVTIEADQVPQVRITAPLDGLELDPDKQRVTVTYEASDDYGLSALELVYRVQGGQEQRVPLRPDEGRATRGSTQWDLASLALKPGQAVAYYLEAKDNDAVAGPKKGVSNSLTLKVYSAAEHRREALQKAEAVWERLVTHLADRMEAGDRPSPATPDAALASRPVDERGQTLALDLGTLAGELEELREPPTELSSALWNVAKELREDVSAVATQRKLLLRLTGKDDSGSKLKLADGKDGALSREVGRRLSLAIATDIASSERNVLYLEALLDRQKLEALKELAKELKEDRAELSRLMEEYARTKDAAAQQALLQQMDALRQRMMELQQRMAELSKGIRDDFMNREALEQLLEEQDLQAKLDEVEKLVKEGKAEEALKKMQELAMQMDELLEALDQAGERADEQADPELARMVEDFQQNLDETAQQQQQLADKTKGLRDKYREQQKERVARQGEALKRELQQKLDELDKSYRQLEQDRFGNRLDERAEEARQEIEHVQQALKADDFDLASETADRLEEEAGGMADQAAEQRRLDELFQNPPEVRRASRQLQDKLSRDAKKAEEVAQKLRDLFPQPGSQMSEEDRQRLQELARQQRGLEKRGQQLEQQMEEIGERAPLFNEDAQAQMQQAGERMQAAGDRLSGRDASRGYGEQQGAMQALKGLQQAMEQAGKSGGKGGIPLPLRRSGGRGTGTEKVEIPDEDPNAAPREFRKDVMDAMKQGAPDRYRDQNKRYYEELVK
ncbi:MAG: DUF4175 family protein [Myxococcales bacterium]|nr:DUF4175 family protein [Myxococcales bacterium]